MQAKWELESIDSICFGSDTRRDQPTAAARQPTAVREDAGEEMLPCDVTSS